MRWRVEVTVHLRPGLADPQGKAIEEALPTFGWRNVSDVRVGKSIVLSIESDSLEDVERQAEEIARRVLSNPVIEDFAISHRSEVER